MIFNRYDDTFIGLHPEGRWSNHDEQGNVLFC